MKRIKLRIASAVITACMLLSIGVPTVNVSTADDVPTIELGSNTVVADEFCDGCNSFESPMTKADADKINGFVTRLYEVCLGRTPDAAGLKEWADTLIKNEATGICVAYGFVFSNEFQNMKMSNEDYIKCMYKAFLGREADASGLSEWTKAMDDGATRLQIFKGFAMSKEFTLICDDYGVFRGDYYDGIDPVQASQVNLFVRRLYVEVLGRDCDYGGLAEWSLLLINHKATGIKTAQGFFNSDEFKYRNLCNSCYVNALYRSFLGRTPSKSESKTWVDALEENSRTKVFAGFAESPEFTDICKRYGIDRGDVEKIPQTDINRELFTDPSTRNNIDLVIWAKNAYNQRWGYRFAAYGKLDNGRRYVDCSGLIKSYFWYDFADGLIKYGINGFTASSSEVMWAEAKVKGNMSTMPEIPGLGLWRPGHVAIYIGNGMFIDAANSSIGIRMSTVRTIEWQGWFEIKGLTYIRDKHDIPDFDLRGQTINFGQYGGEVIKWTIVDSKDGNYLLVANNIIDLVPYDDAKKDTTWDRCALRTWLNNDFYKTAFSDSEKKLIQTTSLQPDRNTKYNISAGIATKDKVYILSASDAEYLFSKYPDLKNCTPTEYAASKYKSGSVENYWLRTPAQGYWHNAATEASVKGEINFEGYKGESTNVGVRPMMWIKAA